ncbi:MAG: class I SAM-dependent methyltransferase [Vicinamibacteria bacterium]
MRWFAFGLLRLSRFMERQGLDLATATFSKADLNRLAVAEWEAFGQDAPLVEDEVFVWERAFYAEQIRPGDSVLVVGAGTGRDVLPLLKAGHAVMALDITPQALDVLKGRAAERNLPVVTMQASIVDAALPADTFDVIVFSWFAYGFLLGSEDRRAALRRCASALREGGRLLISYEAKGVDRVPWRRPSWLASTIARVFGGRSMEQGDTLNVTGTSASPSAYFSHRFEPAEIATEVQSEGLHILAHTQPTSGIGVIAATSPRVAS